MIKPEKIYNHMYSAYSSFALLAGIELDIFTLLDEKPMKNGELAKKLGASADRLSILIYALVNAGLLDEKDGFFSNTGEAGIFLVRTSPHYIAGSGDFCRYFWQACLKTADSILADKPSANIEYKKTDNGDVKARLVKLFPQTVNAGKSIAEKVDFTGCKSIIDIGGGTGGVAFGICREYPFLNATVIDLPNMTQVIREFIEESDLRERISARGINILDESPPGNYDIAIARSFIQLFGKSDAAKAILNISRCLHPGSRILIIGRILDNTRVFPSYTAGFNLAFLNIYESGQAYTEQEYYEWLENAGFAHMTVTHNFMDDGQSMVSAIKK